MNRTLVALLLSVSLCGPALAQQATPDADELLALNFYVQQQDADSIAAELRRLRLKYPQWTPPSDLSRIGQTAPSTEIDSFYRHVAEGRFDQAREVLAKARQDFPDWQPPADMTELLEIAEGQVLIDTALAAGDLAGALELARSRPGLLRCDRINNAWRIAEAQQAAGRPADALGTYRAVLGACLVPAELVATLEKADAVASEPELRAMFTQVVARFPDDEARYAELLQRLLAGRGAAPAPTAATSAQPNSASARTAASAGAAAQRSAAAPPAPNPAAQGSDRPAAAPPPAARAAAAASPSRTAGGSLQAMVAAGDWVGCLERTAGATAATAIYQRGWCAYSLDRPMEAIAAFRSALGGRLDATQRRDAAYGIALAYLKLQMPEEAARIAATTDFDRQQRIEVERQILDQRGVMAYKKHQYRQAIQYFDAMEQVSGSIRRDLAILRAYAYLRSGDRARARAEFQRLNAELSTRESRAGLQAVAE